MDRATLSRDSANTLHCALELSKKSWLLAIQFPDREQPSLYSIEGGDAEKLMAKLTAARDRWAKVSGAVPVITLCYEVGHDAFWLARFLKARGGPLYRLGLTFGSERSGRATSIPNLRVGVVDEQFRRGCGRYEENCMT
jgi:hypothetical protein